MHKATIKRLTALLEKLKVILEEIGKVLEEDKNFLKKTLLEKRKKGAKIYFSKEEIIIHTYDNITQNSIVQYLNARTWNNIMIEIDYKDQDLTCFPAISLEMLNWLRNNSNDFQFNIFHRKNIKEEWKMLLPTTKVVK